MINTLTCVHDYSHKILHSGNQDTDRKGTSNKMRSVLCTRDLKIELRVGLAIFFLFYGIEAWNINAASIIKLVSFELWVYRRIFKISWTKQVTNNKVL